MVSLFGPPSSAKLSWVYSILYILYYILYVIYFILYIIYIIYIYILYYIYYILLYVYILYFIYFNILFYILYYFINLIYLILYIVDFDTYFHINNFKVLCEFSTFIVFIRLYAKSGYRIHIKIYLFTAFWNRNCQSFDDKINIV